MDHLCYFVTSQQTHVPGHGHGHVNHPSCLPLTSSSASCSSDLPFSSMSTAISISNPSSMPMPNTRSDEEEWTPEHLDILSSLLHRPPRPFSRNRPPPLVRNQKKVRSMDSLPTRKRYQKTMHMSMSMSMSKPKVFCAAHLADHIRDSGDVVQVLAGSQHLLERGSLSGTIRELGRAGMPLLALETLLWQQDYPHLWPDERTLLSTIQVLAEAAMEDKARNLVMMNTTMTMNPSSSNPMRDRFGALICGLVSARRLHEALLVKEEAESYGFTIGQSSYAELILLASRLNQGNVVKNLLKEMGGFPELKLGLEHVTSVMAACRKARMYEVVPSLFTWWKSAGFLPNVIMFELVVTSLLSMGKPRDALAIYWEMEEMGCCLDLRVYKAFLSVCVELSDSTKALRLFSRMKDAQISPDRDVYENMIRVCCKDGRFGKAQEFLDAMKRADLPIMHCNLEDYI